MNPRLTILAGAIERLSDADAARLADVLEVALANLDGFAEIAAVLRQGAIKHDGGGLGPDGLQTVPDHAAAIIRHATHVASRGKLQHDRDSGHLVAGHVGGRAVLAIQTAVNAARAELERGRELAAADGGGR